MSASIPEAFKDLLERPIVVTLVTLMPDHTPQASPVWFHWDGEHIVINTARGRIKDRNMSQRRKVTVLSVDPNDANRYVEVRGEVAESTEEGGREHIDWLSNRYEGRDFYTHGDIEAKLRQVRVIYKIKPSHIVARD